MSRIFLLYLILMTDSRRSAYSIFLRKRRYFLLLSFSLNYRWKWIIVVPSPNNSSSSLSALGDFLRRVDSCEGNGEKKNKRRPIKQIQWLAVSTIKGEKTGNIGAKTGSRRRKTVSASSEPRTEITLRCIDCWIKWMTSKDAAASN